MKHFVKNEQEIATLKKMADKEWTLNRYRDCGYLWGEMAAILIWGKPQPKPIIEDTNFLM